MVLETIRMDLERPRTVLEGPGSAPEGSGMFRNDPGRARKVLEASGRFRKYPGSTTHYPTPLALGSKPTRLPWPAKGWGAHQGGGILLQVGSPTLHGRFLVGRFGRFGRFGSPSWTPHPPYCAPRASW